MKKKRSHLILCGVPQLAALIRYPSCTFNQKPGKQRKTKYYIEDSKW